MLLTGTRGAWGGKEIPGPLVVTRIPEVNIPVCVVKNTSVMACVSACVKLVHGPVQTGDGCGEPFVPYGAVLVTAPGSRNGVYEVRGALRARPARARLRDPAWKPSTSDTSRPRGRLKWWRVLMEFGTRGFPRGRVCGASRAACRVFCSRSGFLGRCARANLHGKPRRFGMRVTSPGISRHEGRVNSARCPAWGIPRKRALIAIDRVTSWLHGSAIGGDVSIAHKDERASRKPPPWRCRKIFFFKSLAPGTQPGVWAKEAIVSGMG